ncbi:ParA family protein [Jiangella aurantiaca]|uniref:ParA family protein n=1 Tax=Jiangella aurantiaca TaxID=2530373 RepID=UPI00193D5CE6|nr:ParA family protein [Jiangella aurantiaca]
MSVLSLKGGVGKTTVTLGLAGAAAAQKLRCVVVDLDPQANATTVLAPDGVQFTANDILTGDRPVAIGDALAVSGWGEPVRVLAGEPALERRNHPPDGHPGRHHVRAALAGLRDADLVLIDCPPSLAELTRNALAASDTALIVTEATAFALAGAQQALDAVDAVRSAHNLRLRPAGIVVNRFRVGAAEHRFRLDELIAAYRDLVIDPVLPERSAVTRAQGAGVPIQRWPSPGAREVSRVFAGYLTLLTTARTGAGPFSKGASR